jgi:predicted acylesterase/phospholipase RssA
MSSHDPGAAGGPDAAPSAPATPPNPSIDPSPPASDLSAAPSAPATPPNPSIDPSPPASDLSAAPPAGTPPDAAAADLAALPEPAAPTAAPRGPLGNLALAFSGGGYRAAGFQLGVLKLLERVDLLRSVTALSTVSGGTIVGMAWVESLIHGRPFAEFVQRFGDFLKRTNVIHGALENLTSNRGEQPSLIRSAADVYAHPSFLGEHRFAEVLDSDRLPLDEVIFNSTEFHSGVDFRFRRSSNASAVIGNGNFPLPREVAANLRLADVTAASSCFPSAFEPFLFPDHFTWPDDFPLSTVRDVLGDRFRGGLPLMDGGIYDNQGVGSLMLAYAKAPEPPVLLVCDTTQPVGTLWAYPPPRGRGWLTLRMVNWLGWIVFLLSVFSVVGLLVSAWRNRGYISLHHMLLHWTAVYLLPLATSLAVAIGMLWLRRQFKAVQAMLKKDVQIGDAWNDLEGLTVAELVTLIQLRVSSVVALTASIFMKRVRGLIYQALFADDRYKNRRIANLIYSLTLGSRLFDRYPWLRPGARLRELADRASEVGTALWMTDATQLDLLVSTGEATTCFSLLKYILELPADRQQDPAVAAVFQRLREVWDELNRAAPASG